VGFTILFLVALIASILIAWLFTFTGFYIRGNFLNLVNIQVVCVFGSLIFTTVEKYAGRIKQTKLTREYRVVKASFTWFLLSFTVSLCLWFIVGGNIRFLDSGTIYNWVVLGTLLLPITYAQLLIYSQVCLLIGIVVLFGLLV